MDNNFYRVVGSGYQLWRTMLVIAVKLREVYDVANAYFPNDIERKNHMMPIFLRMINSSAKTLKRFVVMRKSRVGNPIHNFIDCRFMKNQYRVVEKEILTNQIIGSYPMSRCDSSSMSTWAEPWDYQRHKKYAMEGHLYSPDSMLWADIFMHKFGHTGDIRNLKKWVRSGAPPVFLRGGCSAEQSSYELCCILLSCCTDRYIYKMTILLAPYITLSPARFWRSIKTSYEIHKTSYEIHKTTTYSWMTKKKLRRIYNILREYNITMIPDEFENNLKTL